MTVRSQLQSEAIECPLCLGNGELKRIEVLDRLGVKDFARVAQLSAEEAFRLLQAKHDREHETAWSRFEGEVAKRTAEIKERHKDELRSAQLERDNLTRRVEECGVGLSRLRCDAQRLDGNHHRYVLCCTALLGQPPIPETWADWLLPHLEPVTTLQWNCTLQGESQKRSGGAEKVVMACKLCRSENQPEFGAEINIHFPGRKCLDKPAVLAFPQLVVCLDCGFSQFTLPETELRLLGEGVAGSV